MVQHTLVQKEMVHIHPQRRQASSPRKIRKDVQKALEDVKKGSLDQFSRLNLIVGTTGAGKTTLLNYLEEIPLIVEAHDFKAVLQTKQTGNCAAVISHENKSCTTIPNVSSIDDVTYVDCPGEFDCTTLTQTLINCCVKTFFADKGEFVKITVVVPESSLRESRGAHLKLLFSQLSNFVADWKAISDNNSFSIVVTAVDRDGYAKEAILRTLTGISRDGGLDEDVQSLLKNVIDNNLVGVFCSPQKARQFSRKNGRVPVGDLYEPYQDEGEPFTLYDRDEILRMFRGVRFLGTEGRTLFNQNLEPTAQQKVGEMCTNLATAINEEVGCLALPLPLGETSFFKTLENDVLLCNSYEDLINIFVKDENISDLKEKLIDFKFFKGLDATFVDGKFERLKQKIVVAVRQQVGAICTNLANAIYVEVEGLALPLSLEASLFKTLEHDVLLCNSYEDLLIIFVKYENISALNVKLIDFKIFKGLDATFVDGKFEILKQKILYAVIQQVRVICTNLANAIYVEVECLALPLSETSDFKALENSVLLCNSYDDLILIFVKDENISGLKEKLRDFKIFKDLVANFVDGKFEILKRKIVNTIIEKGQEAEHSHFDFDPVTKKMTWTAFNLKLSEVKLRIIPAFTMLEILVFNNFDVDCDLPQKDFGGKDISIVAFNWKKTGSYKFDLSGDDGKPTSGPSPVPFPGETGHNGGNFLGVGKNFEGPPLTIISRGGEGANGQDASNGSNGADREGASSADFNDTELEDHYRVHGEDTGREWNGHVKFKYTRYKRKGGSFERGEDGQNAYTGGKGGKGGIAGQLTAHGGDFNFDTRPAPDGESGRDGQPGRGGAGGYGYTRYYEGPGWAPDGVGRVFTGIFTAGLHEAAVAAQKKHNRGWFGGKKVDYGARGDDGQLITNNAEPTPPKAKTHLSLEEIKASALQFVSANGAIKYHDTESFKALVHLIN